MCKETSVHFASCPEVRSWITIEPFTEDAAGVFVDPLTVEHHQCGKVVTRPKDTTSWPSPPDGGQVLLEFENCSSHECCIVWKYFKRCQRGLKTSGPYINCPNLWVNHTYCPIQQLAQMIGVPSLEIREKSEVSLVHTDDAPSMLWKPVIPHYPQTLVYTSELRTDEDYRKMSALRQAFFLTARQLHMEKHLCANVRNILEELTRCLIAEQKKRTCEQRGKQFTMWFVSMLLCLEPDMKSIEYRFLLIIALARDMHKSLHGLVELVNGPADPLVSRISMPDTTEGRYDELNWTLRDFSGPLKELGDIPSLFQQSLSGYQRRLRKMGVSKAELEAHFAEVERSLPPIDSYINDFREF